MTRAISMAAAGFVLGIAATYVAFHHPRDAVQTSPPLIENVPTISQEAAESHRDSRYARIGSIEQTLALPGDFAQTEALYALAGRSDSAGVQDLIFQAVRITDPSDRSAALDILFLRLTELDPRSALALSRAGEFRDNRQLEAKVWYNWGKLDLEQALAAAAALDSAGQRHLAAQSLYAAYDYGGNDTIDRIEEALRIPPGSATRAAHLSLLADRDPVDAVNFINSMRNISSRQEAAAHLGRHLGRLPGKRTEQYASLFTDTAARQSFTHAASSAEAETDPEAVLDEWLGGKRSMNEMIQVYTAMKSLAARDMEKALEYFEQIPNSRYRRMLAGPIGEVLADSDPQRAFEWAKENDPGMNSGLYAGIVASVAAMDPDLALESARLLPPGMQRRQALNGAVMAISFQDPQKAVALLDQIEQREVRDEIAQNLATMWVQNDPDAALNWMLSRDISERRALLAGAASRLTETDLDLALQWLPRLDQESQRMWRLQIAPSLARQRSVGEAQRFISGFEGTEEYPQLVASTVNGIAEEDIGAAVELARLVPAGPERDMIYGGLISQFGYHDPQQAATFVTSISDAAQRERATASLAMMWSHRDAEAAQQWVQDLPQGVARDGAIVNLASNWNEMTPSRRLLVNSIGDLERRKQALVMHIHNVAQTDGQRAERLMNDLDLNEEERRQLVETIHMIGTMR
jgi:hypothetical protein